MELCDLLVGAEHLVEEPLDTGQDEGEEEEDVGEVLGELTDAGLRAELLGKVE